MYTHLRRILVAGVSTALMLTALAAGAQAPAMTFGTPSGRQATVTNIGDRLQVVFQPAEWPNAQWTAAAGSAWDWSKNGTLVFDAANPGSDVIDFSVRVDDDPAADGVHHCHTAGASLAPGQHGTFFVELAAVDSKAVMGMNAEPPETAQRGMTALNGSGAVDPSHIVAFQIFLHRPPAPRTLLFSHFHLLPSQSSDTLYHGIVDQFGQYSKAEWPGKVHAETEFAERRTGEAHALAATPSLPGRDSYGGWADGPTLPKTGFFATAKRGGRWWLVTPSGHLFLSFGMDVAEHREATIVDPRGAMFTWLPSAADPLAAFYGQTDRVLYGPYKSGRTFDFYEANLQRKYGTGYAEAWNETTAARLRSWGFNTIGNWSNESLEAARQIPYTATLGIQGPHARVSAGSDYWGQMHDPFDPQFAVDCDTSFRDKATRLKNDPLCLGWFVDNELSWSGGSVEKGRYGLVYGVLSAPADQPAKLALISQLKAKYGTIDKFSAAWGLTLAGWDAMNAPVTAGQTPSEAQKADMSAFMVSFARKYFTTVRDSLKKYDPNHLYLGCRFADGGYNPDALRAAAEVCDVISCNIYQRSLKDEEIQNGLGFPADPMDLNKPCLIGEFHCGALDRGMFHPGLVATDNQADRARTFTQYMQSVIDNPAFVGAHWFQYVDEPLTGRTLDGENYNIGFVTVTDTPYPEMVQAAQTVLGTAYVRRSGR